MASKKLIGVVAQVQKQDVKIQQMILNASLKKNGLTAAKRKADDRAKYEGGGQVKKTRLWQLDLERRQAALFFVAELCEDPAFLEACRDRAKAVKAGRAWSASDGRLAFVGSPATNPPISETATSKSAPRPTCATGPVPASPAQQMTVRFRGKIPPGHKLRSLGLHYNSDLEQWDGVAVREAVEKEISGFKHLLLSIETVAEDSAVSKSGADIGGGFLNGVRVDLEA